MTLYFQLLPRTGLNAEDPVEVTMVATARTAFVQRTLQKTATDRINIRETVVCGAAVMVVMEAMVAMA
jgi:hypothetical protein